MPRYDLIFCVFRAAAFFQNADNDRLQQTFVLNAIGKQFNVFRAVNLFVIGNNMLIDKIGLRASNVVAGINCSDEHKQRLNAISQKINCGSIKEAQISENEFILIK